MVAAQMAGVHASAIAGDQEGVQANMAAMQEDLRKSIKLADPHRQVDRESARTAARRVDGVRSVARIDRENLLVIVDRNEARTKNGVRLEYHQFLGQVNKAPLPSSLTGPDRSPDPARHLRCTRGQALILSGWRGMAEPND